MGELYENKTEKKRGPGIVPSVKCLTLGFGSGPDLRVVRLNPLSRLGWA